MVLVLVILGPVAAGRARALRAGRDLLPGRTHPSYGPEPKPENESGPPTPVASPAEAERQALSSPSRRELDRSALRAGLVEPGDPAFRTVLDFEHLPRDEVFVQLGHREG
ncbi:hypothetical protein ABZ499_23695 [Streptomyces sp. NPDC019990]|uniref:hypothetical protein n=1 Tax=Streptomyces sp. NPDC019990 TaxID=3154693 RepID=UPI003403264D